MNLIDGGIIAVIGVLLGAGGVLYGAKATDAATSVVGALKKWLQGKKTTIAGGALKAYIATQIGSGYFANHDAVYQMGASGLDTDTWLWLGALLASFLPDFLHAQTERLAKKLSEEQRAAFGRLMVGVANIAQDVAETVKLPPTPESKA